MNTNTQNGGYNDNRNRGDNGNFDGRVMGFIFPTTWGMVTSYSTKTKRGFMMNTVKNAIAKFYIATRNVLTDESGQTIFETMVILIMLAIVAIVVATMFMGVCDNVGMDGSLGEMLNID